MKKNLKNKVLIITTIIFFLIVNSKYFWQGKMGLLAFPFFIFLVIIFLILTATCSFQIKKGRDEKFTNHNRNWTIGILIITLVLILIKPNGLIDFDKLEGEDLFIAKAEGAANCMTTFKIKQNNKFKGISVCFGISEVKGHYEIRNDTLFFLNVNIPIGNDEYYNFAVLKKSKRRDELALFRYKNKKNTIGRELRIIKNKLTE